MTSETENWSWWVGRDEERYTTECATKEEAVYIAREKYEGAYICEAQKLANIKLSGYFDADFFVENAEDNAYDDHGDHESDDVIFDVTPDQRRDLDAMVRAAIDAWQEKHGLKFTGFLFSASRNHEYIDGPEDEATQ
ncbi:MAG: hypothetical protein JXQ79_03270 [Rhodobacteraceae bacterium]|nr:hypothetical protein [Paracoccaceae bacterium]